MSELPQFKGSPYFQIVAREEPHDIEKFKPLFGVHFPECIFGNEFGCPNPTRFTGGEIIQKIKNATNIICGSDLQERLNYTAHLQAWAGLLRELTLDDLISGDTYEIVVWF